MRQVQGLDSSACVDRWGPTMGGGGRNFHLSFLSLLLLLSVLSHTRFWVCFFSWKKIHHGTNKGGYVHRFFLRGQPDLHHKVVRRSGSKDLGNPLDHQVHHPLNVSNNDNNKKDDSHVDTIEVADHSYRISPQQSSSSSSSSLGESDIHPLFDESFERRQDHDDHDDHDDEHGHFHHHHRRHWRTDDGGSTPDLDYDGLNEDDLDIVAFLNHHEGSSSPTRDEEEEEEAILSHRPFKTGELNSTTNTTTLNGSTTKTTMMKDDDDEVILLDESLDSTEDHNFPCKLHLMLESADKDGYNHIVSWVKDGLAFRVWNNKEFVSKVLPFYFDQSKYESFRRQLNLYGFSRISSGNDRGVISHPFFIRGNRGRCKDIKRKAQPKGGSGGGGVVVMTTNRPKTTTTTTRTPSRTPSSSIPITA